MVNRSATPRDNERLLHVPTNCASMQAFVAAFAPMATPDSLSVPVKDPPATGTAVVLRVSLADGREALLARGQVVEVLPAQGGSGQRTVRVKVLEMDEANQLLFTQLSEAGHASSPRRQAEELTVVPSGAMAPVVTLPLPRTASSGVRNIAGPPPIPRAATPLPPLRPRNPSSELPSVPGPSLPRSSGPRSFVPQSPGAPSSVPPSSVPPSSVNQPSQPASSFVASSPVPVGVPFEQTTAAARRPEMLSRDQPHDASPDDITDNLVISSWPEALRRLIRSSLVRRALPVAACTLIGWLVGYQMGKLQRPEPRPEAELTEPVPESAPTAARAQERPAPPSAKPAAGTAEAERDVVASHADRGQAPEEPSAGTRERGASPSGRPLPARAEESGGKAVAPTAAGSCLVSVQTRPDDVVVRWGGRVLGKTPLGEMPVPCGAAVVVFERERYESVSRTLVADAKSPLVVKQRLDRPPARVKVTSVPAGAMVAVNGRSVGKTPSTVSVSRYESAKIELKLDGYKPWRSTLHVKEPQTALDVKLDASASGSGSGSTGKGMRR